VLDDPEDKNSKLFVKAKNNLAPISGTDRHDMNRIVPSRTKCCC